MEKKIIIALVWIIVIWLCIWFPVDIFSARPDARLSSNVLLSTMVNSLMIVIGYVASKIIK